MKLDSHHCTYCGTFVRVCDGEICDICFQKYWDAKNECFLACARCIHCHAILIQDGESCESCAKNASIEAFNIKQQFEGDNEVYH